VSDTEPTPAPVEDPGEDTKEHPVVDELRERLDDDVPPRDDDPDRPDRTHDHAPPRDDDPPDDPEAT
jgi:hypothetical protein